MRKYEYETGRFTSIDPLWNKYYGWTPYQYSMNSPIGFVDVDGRIVKAVDSESRNNIFNSVEPQFRNLVKFNDDGVVYLDGNHNQSPLLKDLSNATNISSLDYLIRSKEIIEVSESSTFNVVDGGEFKTTSLDWEYNGKIIGGGNGITLVKYNPLLGATSQRTDVHEIVVSPNQFMSFDKKATKGTTTAHELYGHLLLHFFNLEFIGHNGKVGDFIEKVENRARDETR